jgi:hypothetical protein
MDTFLPPVERPKSLAMRVAYYFTRRQFGKVLCDVGRNTSRHNVPQETGRAR